MDVTIPKIYLIEHNNHIIGAYTDLEAAKIFIYGCFQKGLIQSDVTIKTYYANSCYHTDNVLITMKAFNNSMQLFDNQQTEFSLAKLNLTKSETGFTPVDKIKNNTKQLSNIDYNNPALLEMAKQKIDIQHKINLLKTQKKKIEESKSTYSNDLKLFELFTENIKNNSNFYIPDIFRQKFEIMTELNNNNKLSWENFVKVYQPSNLYNDYFDDNEYENMFMSSDNISEELNIESDSSTEVSSSSCSSTDVCSESSNEINSSENND
jgi:hypothetical protein